MMTVHNTILDKAKVLSNELKYEIDRYSPNLLNLFPVEYYWDCLKTYPKVGTYRYVSKEILKLCADIVDYSDEATLELYHKLIIVTLLIDAQFQIEANEFPEEIKKWYALHFNSILGKIKNDSIRRGAYLIHSDRLFKDLGICSMKLIPAGVRKIHLETLPVKRFLFQNGLNQFIRGISCIIFDLKGIHPVFHGHLDSRDRQTLAEFNPEGWIRHFKMVAELLKINKGVKGVIGLTWFYDPKLTFISPELAYLRELVEENGASLFLVGSNRATIKNAIRLSPKRRKLYKSGEYIPNSYLYIWPRNKIIQWAEKT